MFKRNVLDRGDDFITVIITIQYVAHNSSKQPTYYIIPICITYSQTHIANINNGYQLDQSKQPYCSDRNVLFLR